MIPGVQPATAKMFKEEPMKSLSQLAELYENWAMTNEARAEEILAGEDSNVDEIQEHQFERAVQLMDEAVSLKKIAADLR
jgi:hypothetical protein